MRQLSEGWERTIVLNFAYSAAMTVSMFCLALSPTIASELEKRVHPWLVYTIRSFFLLLAGFLGPTAALFVAQAPAAVSTSADALEEKFNEARDTRKHFHPGVRDGQLQRRSGRRLLCVRLCDGPTEI
jgi:hypothetical protein